MTKTTENDAAARGWTGRLVAAVAAHPLLLDWARWVLEAGFRGERRVVEEAAIPRNARVLDLGCGTGAMRGTFADAVYVGVDPCPALLVRARRKHPGSAFLAMDGRRLGFRDAAFDVVVIGGVLHHLDAVAADAVLSEVRRVLEPENGRLVAWEDIPCRSRGNLLGRWVHSRDAGAHIRPSAEYVDMVGKHLHVVRHDTMRSGVCDYVTIVAGTEPSLADTAQQPPHPGPPAAASSR